MNQNDVCARCGHPLSAHGGPRNGGSCHHGRYGGVAAAAQLVVAAVLRGVPKERYEPLVEEVRNERPCGCHRFTKKLANVPQGGSMGETTGSKEPGDKP